MPKLSCAVVRTLFVIGTALASAPPAARDTVSTDNEGTWTEEVGQLLAAAGG